jgi:transposase-like protein
MLPRIIQLKILSELSIGKYTKYELVKPYGIASSTINEWIKKFERKDLMNTMVMVETKHEITRLKALYKETEQLKNGSLKKY